MFCRFGSASKTLVEYHQNLMCYYSLDGDAFKKDLEIERIQ